MRRHLVDACPPLPYPPALPAYARLNPNSNQDDRLFSAGAALALFSAFWTLSPPYAGALAERLAIRAAAASLQAAGRPEDEATIRDQGAFRRPGDARTPAGAHLEAWLILTRLRDGWRGLSAERLAQLAQLFDQPLYHPPGELLAAITRRIAAVLNPLEAAIQAATSCFEAEPRNEPLAHLVADAVLATRFGWERPLPLLAAQIAAPALRSGGTRRRSRPGDALWSPTATGAYILAIAQAVQPAEELARRGAALRAAAPRLRAKSANQVVAALLAHSCLSGSYPVTGMSDRGLRRLFERLVQAGLVRELSGRTTFRLYGL